MNIAQLVWLRRARGSPQLVKTQGFCSPGGRMEAQNHKKHKALVAPKAVGRPKLYGNIRFLLPRRPSGGPTNTCENTRFLLPRRPPGGPNCAKNNMVIALQQAAWGPTFKMIQGVCSPRGCREAKHLRNCNPFGKPAGPPQLKCGCWMMDGG